jgi:hypothetical protein
LPTLQPNCLPPALPPGLALLGLGNGRRERYPLPPYREDRPPGLDAPV